MDLARPERAEPYRARLGLDPGPPRLGLALTLACLASPATAVDNPQACQTLAQTVFTKSQTDPITWHLPAPDLTARTAFLNWSQAPARPDLPLRGAQIEVTTCWYVTSEGQTCMMGFARETPPNRTGLSTLTMQPLGAEPCAHG